MAWTKVKEQGMLNRSVRGVGESTATRYYTATSDTATTTWAAEAASDGTTTIPVTGELLPGDALGRQCKTVEARAENDSFNKVFTIQCDYSNALQTSPLDQPARISWDFDDATQKYFFDNDPSPPSGGPGKPVVNSAGESFEDLLERETGSIRATVKKYIAANAYDAGQAVAFKDSVCSDSFTIDNVNISAGQGKMKALTAGEVQTMMVNGVQVQYRERTMTLQFRNSWKDLVDDRGFNEADTNNSGKLKEIVKGTPPTKTDKPWPLDGNGGAKPNVTDTPAQLTFYPYTPRSFSGFSFT